MAHVCALCASARDDLRNCARGRSSSSVYRPYRHYALLRWSRFNCSIHNRHVHPVCVAVRVNDAQLVMLSERAHYDHSQTGYLHKRAADSTKWQLRWFVLYQVSVCIVYRDERARSLLDRTETRRFGSLHEINKENRSRI